MLSCLHWLVIDLGPQIVSLSTEEYSHLPVHHSGTLCVSWDIIECSHFVWLHRDVCALLSRSSHQNSDNSALGNWGYYLIYFSVWICLAIYSISSCKCFWCLQRCLFLASKWTSARTFSCCHYRLNDNCRFVASWFCVYSRSCQCS